MGNVVKELKGASGATATIVETRYETSIDYAVTTKFQQWTEVKHAETLELAESYAEGSIQTLENMMPSDK